MSKISELSDGGALQSTDYLIAVRSGGNVKVQPGSMTVDINGGTIDGVTIGGSSAGAGSFTTLTTSSTVTHNGGTANGVAYLNGSKVLTTGSALTFDGTNLTFNGDSSIDIGLTTTGSGTIGRADRAFVKFTRNDFDGILSFHTTTSGSGGLGERMRITDTGNVGIGTTSPSSTFQVGVPLTATAGIRVSGSNLNIDAGYQSAGVNGTAAAPCLIIGGDANTGLFHPASDTLAISTLGNEAIRIDSSQNLLVGTTTSNAVGVSSGGTSTGVEFQGDGEIQVGSDGDKCAIFNRQSSDGEIIRFRKDGSTVGSIGVEGGSRPYFSRAGSGGGIGFGGSGDLIPTNESGVNNDNSLDLGTAVVRWDDVYATNGTIQTSDANEKENIRELLEAEARVAQAAKGLLRAFQWKDSVAEKGDDARIHFGIIAQDLQAAFEAEGLDAGRYAMFIYSTWTDEETGEERSRMGVRYSELLAFIIAAL